MKEKCMSLRNIPDHMWTTYLLWPVARCLANLSKWPSCSSKFALTQKVKALYENHFVQNISSLWGITFLYLEEKVFAVQGLIYFKDYGPNNYFLFSNCIQLQAENNWKPCNLTLQYVNLFTSRLQSAAFFSVTSIKATKQQLTQIYGFHPLQSRVGTYLLLTATYF